MSRKLTVLIAVLGLFVALLPAAGASAAPRFRPGAPGIGDPYYPLDGNGGYDVAHYDLAVGYAPDTDVLKGVATISARATQDLSAFNLDFVGLTVRSVQVDGRSAPWSRDAGELTVRPRAGIPNGTRFTVVVRYDGVPQMLDEFGGSGFITTPDGAVVVGEPHVAATWFPANDHPRDRASYTFHITVPVGVEAIANGVLARHTTSRSSTTWTWDAVEPMASYLATMSIGQFDITSYQRAGIKYWDAIASPLTADRLPAITATTGTQFLFSQAADASYKRLTRTLEVPPGGSTVTFRVNRDTEPTWDHLFVEARTAGGDDWTTLPDANGHTTTDVGSCGSFFPEHPFLEHYLTRVVVDAGDPTDPNDDVFGCDPTGTTGVWNAASGSGSGWESWSVALANDTATTRQVEVSLSYESDSSVQGRGVAIDDIVVSNGAGSTSFEADADVLDGWTAPTAGPEGSGDNANTWVPETFVAAVPGTGASVQKSFDKQPEIIAFEAGIFGRYPFTASGGIVPDLAVGFALENQTRPTYSRLFFQFGDGGNDGVVVHELAHQWFGDSLTVNSWRDIWLNEGFATYAEWLWGETQGNGTPQEIFDFLSTIPADDAFWTGAVGDPGTARLFDDLVYTRGAMTLQALRMQVGDVAFFRILRDWARTQAGSTVSTREFVALAERVSHQDLDAFFAAWLSEGKPAGLPEAPPLAALRAAQPAPMPITLSNEIDRSKVQATARALTRASGR
jgi:hypothetical protein